MWILLISWVHTHILPPFLPLLNLVHECQGQARLCPLRTSLMTGAEGVQKGKGSVY